MIDMIIVAYRFGNILSLARLVSMILQEALHHLFKPFMIENILFKRSFSIVVIMNFEIREIQT